MLLKREYNRNSSRAGDGLFEHFSCALHTGCFHRARYGGAELHTVSAILGGIASQEAVKLITHQFVPVNNTFVYNGINGTTAALTV